MVTISKPVQAKVKQEVKRSTKAQEASICSEMLMRKKLTMLKRSWSKNFKVVKRL